MLVQTKIALNDRSIPDPRVKRSDAPSPIGAEYATTQNGSQTQSISTMHVARYASRKTENPPWLCPPLIEIQQLVGASDSPEALLKQNTQLLQ